MIINKSFKFRLLPTDEQNVILLRHGGNVRFAWNKLLEFANDPEELIDVNLMTLQEQLVRIKNSNEFLKETHSQPLQIQADRLNKAFKKSRDRKIVKERKIRINRASKIKNPEIREKKLKKAENYGMPKFKSKEFHNDSLFYPQNFKFRKKSIFFPKLGWIKCLQHRTLEGTPKNVTIKQDGEFWNCSVCCEVEIADSSFVPLEQANIVGIDMGIKSFAVLSDGTVIENPKFLKKFEKRIKIEQKKLKRKQLKVEMVDGKEVKTSSKNRIKQLGKLQKQYRDLRNSRSNFLHQESHRMITKYDGFCAEALDIENMIREAKSGNKKHMTRSIYDCSWFEFLRLLEYKSLWNSKYFQKIGEFFPSTQTCPICGHVQKEITLKDRVLHCPCCGAIMDRDLRSSKMTLKEGVRLIREFLVLKEPQELKTVGEVVSDNFYEAVTSASSKPIKKSKDFSIG